MPMIDDPRAFLSDLFRRAVEAADPATTIVRHLPARPKGRTIVIGAGKAACQMAKAFENAWGEPVEGLVVTRHGAEEPCRHVRVLTASHPLPDEAGIHAARALLDQVSGLTEDDLVVALISGGGSALLPSPPEGFTLSDEIELNRALLHSGAPISAMNVIRKHFSGIKGGRLAAAAAPARVVTLVISDVPGDRPELVASGPTLPDAEGRNEALAAIRDYRIALPPAILDAIAKAEAPRPDDPVFARNETHIISSARQSLEAAAAEAANAGIETAILSDAIEGEARDIGLMHAAIAREIATRNAPFSKPVLLLSGGETTVTIGSSPAGRGGRNCEFLLSFALATEGLSGLHALAADTDGIDGTEDNAGAISDGETARRIRERGGDGRTLLANHDAWNAFSLSGDLFITGPTGTNVNDFRAILIT